MIRENQQLLNQFNVLTDAVAVFLAMLVSYWLRFSLFRGIKGMPFNYYVWLGVVAAALTLVVFAVAGLYESFRAVRFHVEAGRVVVLELLVALIVMAAMFVLRLGETSRWSVAFFYGVSVLLLVGKRAALRLLLHHYRAMGFNQKRVLLVGHGESAEAYLFFTDRQGNVLIASDPDKLTTTTVPLDICQRANAVADPDARHYHAFGDLGGALTEKSYIAAVETIDDQSLFSGWLMAFWQKSRGLLCGVVQGALFVFLLLCFGLLSGSPLQEMQLVRFGVTLLFGCIGGVLGMLRSERKRRV